MANLFGKFLAFFAALSLSTASVCCQHLTNKFSFSRKRSTCFSLVRISPFSRYTFSSPSLGYIVSFISYYAVKRNLHKKHFTLFSQVNEEYTEGVKMA